MLRYLRPFQLRRFASRQHIPLRTYPQLSTHDGTYKVQRVQFIRPLPRRVQTFAFWLFVIPAFYIILDSAIYDDEEEEVEEHSDQTHEVSQRSTKLGQTAIRPVYGTSAPSVEAVERYSKEDDTRSTVDIEDEEEDDDATFVPLGWPKQLPQTYYKGSDPEWQSFLEFNKDPKKAAALQRELVRVVGSYALKHHRSLRNSLGQPVKVHKVWLDIDYPDGPPREYERSGLEIGDDYIGWTTRPVTAHNVARLTQFVFPTSTFSSFKASWNVLWSLQVARIKKLLNLDSDSGNDGSIGNLFKPAQEPNDAAIRGGGQPGLNSGLVSQPPPKLIDTNSSVVESMDSKLKGVLPARPPLPQPHGDMGIAMGAFKRELARSWKPAGELAPRGTFWMSGLFELRGPNAACILEVVATYHPVDRQWTSIGWKIRRLRLNSQPPKGGP